MRAKYSLLFNFLVSGWLTPQLAYGFEQLHQGLIGESLTHDHIFISKNMGSEIVNIPLYGWGTLWPFADDGRNGESDDGTNFGRRVAMALSDGQQVMLTCATAPSNYRESARPWNMQERVKNDMEDRYAQRCAEVVRRWPAITRVQVWNEFKGYWLGGSEQRWDYQSYTRFYNKVYLAVKAVNPKVRVGGGYLALGKGRGHDKSYDGVMIDYRTMDALAYWLRYAVAYDAVCIDARRTPDEFSSITRVVRRMAGGKPIWWSEFYSIDSTAMRASRDEIAKDQRKGDVALWWAESRFDWGQPQ